MKSNHELDDRKMKILQTIIKTYLETGADLEVKEVP